MKSWIERQRNIIDFTVASLARRKGKNLALVAVYTFVVLLLASVIFFTGALKKEAALTLGEAAPFWHEARPSLTSRHLPAAVLAGAWLLLCAVSFLGYLARRARTDAEEAAAAAPVRSRIRLSNRDRSVLAA